MCYLYLSIVAFSLLCEVKCSPKIVFAHGEIRLREKIYETYVESLLSLLSFRDIETE
jgi:hypothetical protein